MKTRIIQTRFYDDDFVVETDLITQHLYLYLLTCQYINISGIFQLHPKKIQLEAKMTPNQFRDASKSLADSGKVSFYNGWVYVRNAMKNNNYVKSPDNQKAYERELSLVPKEVKDFFDSTVDTTVGVLPTVTINKKSEIINQKSEILLCNLSPEDIKDIATSLNVKEKDVWWNLEKLRDYVKSNGVKYKDWKAALRNWIRRDIERGKIVPVREAPKDSHIELSDEQRLHNLERLKSIKNQVFNKI